MDSVRTSYYYYYYILNKNNGRIFTTRLYKFFMAFRRSSTDKQSIPVMPISVMQSLHI